MKSVYLPNLESHVLLCSQQGFDVVQIYICIYAQVIILPNAGNMFYAR